MRNLRQKGKLITLEKFKNKQEINYFSKGEKDNEKDKKGFYPR